MAVSMALFEHASGYGLFHVKEFEEIAMLQSAVEESVTDISAFNSVVTLQSFQPFKNAEDALANINAVSEGLCSDQLKFFLQSNMPKKLKKVTLGVLDPKLGAAVSESIGVKVSFEISDRCPKIGFRILEAPWRHLNKDFLPKFCPI